MKIHIVESNKGRRRIRPLGVLTLLALCALSFLAIPTACFRVATGTLPPMDGPFLVFCFLAACSSFTTILIASFRLPLAKLPKAGGVDD